MSVAGRSLLAKQGLPPEGERVFRQFANQIGQDLEPFRQDLIEAIESGRIDPSSIDSIRAEAEIIAGNYTNDIQVTFEDYTGQGAEAGRAATVRQHQLDVAFDIVPQSTLDEFENWSEEMAGEVLETITEDTTQYIRSAHEEGLSIDEIASEVNDELFDNRLQDWQAERTARTATISSSNAGNHSALVDASSVVGEEWLDTADHRTRDTHRAAGGQIVAVGTTFLVGSSEARYPGDPNLPVGEIANCRCTIVPVFADELTNTQLARLMQGGRLNV